MSETRKIAAILAADVVGFSRMASADEDRTLARLRTLRAELIDPTVAGQNGRVFKRTGDGALVEFRRVVEAVRCAITRSERDDRAQLWDARRPAHRVPDRHSPRRRRRGKRPRPNARRGEYRGAVGGYRRGRRYLFVRGRLPASERAARPRHHRT